MDLMVKSKALRLRSHLDKYLVANDDGTTVRQSRNISRRSIWIVEPSPDPGGGGGASSVRLKNYSTGLYLAASDIASLLMAGKRVVQSPLFINNKSKISFIFDWEPIGDVDGLKVLLKARGDEGKFLRANGGPPPWNNSVTHDVPSNGATKFWTIWDVIPVEAPDWKAAPDMRSEPLTRFAPIPQGSMGQEAEGKDKRPHHHEYRKLTNEDDLDHYSFPTILRAEKDVKPSPFQSQLSRELRSLYSNTSNYTSSSSVVSADDSVKSLLVPGGLRAFTHTELSQATNTFSQYNFLGRGGFGSVYRGVLADGDVAIKQLEIGSFQGEREFITEINVISRIHHKNLVSLVGYCISGFERLLVYEFVENNNLAFHLQGNATSVLEWPTRMRLALGAAKGIAYLHEDCHPKIIHRDIKSENILVDSNFIAKVADFGLAKFVLDDKTLVTTRVMGTLGYLAPEFGSSGRFTDKSDVYSFGVVLLELITGRKPLDLVYWASQFLDQALEDVAVETKLIDPKLANKYDRKEMKFMVACAAVCLRRFPDTRPRMSQVVQVLEGNISLEKLKAETARK